jgi:hypothetical protein
MRKITTIAISLVMVASALVIVAPSAAAGLTNEGFETGNFTGWSVYTYGGYAYVSSYYFYPAPIGNYMSVLIGGYGGSWQTITQTAYFNAGETLTGKAAAYFTDYAPYNDEVEVLAGGTSIFYRNIYSGSTPGFVDISWTAPYSGFFTVQLRARNYADSAFDPYLMVDFGAAAARKEIWNEDFESGMSWTVGPIGYNNLWHLTQHRSNSPTHSLYYGRENYWDYDTGTVNYGEVWSPVIPITGDNPGLSFEYWMETENWYPFDTGQAAIEINGMYWQHLGYWYDWYQPWTTESFGIAAAPGDTIRIGFYFDTYDSLFNYYEGWYIDDVIITVDDTGPVPEPELTLLDAYFVPEVVAPGQTAMLTFTVENIGDIDSEIDSVEIGGVGVAKDQDLGDQPKDVAVGDTATFVYAVTVLAGTPAGTTPANILIDDNGPGLDEEVDLGIQWKFQGTENAYQRHARNAMRAMRVCDLNVDAGLIADGGELAAAVALFAVEDFHGAKKAVSGLGGPGAGYWGLAPGQEEGNEGNGNGGLN